MNVKTIKDEMRKCGDGLYEIKTSELVYVGSYGMMGYTREIIFKLIIKDGNIYSQDIYKIISYDRNNKFYVEDKYEKIKLVDNLLKYDIKKIKYFEYRDFKLGWSDEKC